VAVAAAAAAAVAAAQAAVVCVGVIVGGCCLSQPTNPIVHQSSLKHLLTDFDHLLVYQICQQTVSQLHRLFQSVLTLSVKLLRSCLTFEKPRRGQTPPGFVDLITFHQDAVQQDLRAPLF